MRVAIRFRNDKDRAKGAYALAETGPITVLRPGVYVVRKEQLRALNGRDGKPKVDFEVVRPEELKVG